MILNVYKPKGWTSFDVVAKLRNVLGVKKIGHAGTLDPLAQGVLIVLTDKDTKRQSEFMEMPKEYKCEIAFGVESPSYDLEGPVTVKKHNKDLEVLNKELRALLPKYTGKIKQKVPPFSAVMVKGKRLYKFARKGKNSEIEIPVKEIEVYEFEIDDFRNEKIIINEHEVELPILFCTIKCSKGTYIRSLAHDIGRDLGTGGMLTDLTRMEVGNYKVEDSKKIEDF